MQNGQSKMDNTKKLAISGKQHRFNNNNVTDWYLCIYIYHNVWVRPPHVAIWTECNHIWLDTEAIWFVTWYSGNSPQYNWIIVKTCGWQTYVYVIYSTIFFPNGVGGVIVCVLILGVVHDRVKPKTINWYLLLPSYGRRSKKQWLDVMIKCTSELTGLLWNIIPVS
jgi:hypothetical protein